MTPAVSHPPFTVSDRATGSVQCSRRLTPEECVELDAHLQRNPGAWLRIYNPLERPWDFDLSFLGNLPSLRHLDIDADAGQLNDLAALESVTPGLISLSLDTLSRFSEKRLDKPKTNAGSLGRFRRLESLEICGHLKDLGFLCDLGRLSSLSLWRNKLKSLDGIEQLGSLKCFSVRFNGTLAIDAVNACPSLEALEVWDSRGIKGVDRLQHPAIKRAWFISCGRELELCSGANLPALRVAVLHSSQGSGNISRMASAANLTCVVISNSPDRLAYEDFSPLFGHPTLREVRVDNATATTLQELAARQGWKVTQDPNFPADEYLM
ncbi:hypothetical protein [Lysobacter olei]